MKIRFTLLLIFFTGNSYSAESIYYPIIKDLVQYTSSVDAYSSLCIKDFQNKKAKARFFDLITSIKFSMNLSDEGVSKLKERYSSVKKSTVAQLTMLGLDRKKALCKNYLKVFEKFDSKKKEKLNEIAELINKQ